MADTKQLRLAGTRTLAQLHNLIRIEEGDGWIFEDCHVEGHVNVVDLVGSDTIAGDFVLLPADADAPDGKEPQWSGTMRVSGAGCEVALYR